MNSLLKKLALLKLNAVPEPYVHAVHAGIGFAVVMLAGIWMPKWAAGLIMLVVAGAIEFWFDKHYEGQSMSQNLHDWEDYLIGVLASWLI